MNSRIPAASLALAIFGCSSDAINDPVPFYAVASTLSLNGRGTATDRYTAELWVRGNVAYTTSWGTRGGVAGNAIKVWNVAGATPVLLDSVIVADARTLGDVQTTDDGQHLIVPVEGGTSNGIVVYTLVDPVRPVLLTRFQAPLTTRGVHTTAVERVNGVQHAFLCTDAGGGNPGTLLIVSLANPAVPVVVNASITGQPYVHDVFVRDGILFAAAWDAGLRIYDIGGGGRGGSPASPVALGSIQTRGGNVHNVWWYHNANGRKNYAFVGEEGASSGFVSAAGDIHVVDVSDLTQPREVAFYTSPGEGTHNFSMDESRGVLYAAYYNGGVKALDVRGNLSQCDTPQQATDGRCDLARMGRVIATTGLVEPRPAFVWGVQFIAGKVFASDMLNGLWKYDAVIP